MVVYVRFAWWCVPGTTWYDAALREYRAGLVSSGPARFLRWAFAPGAKAWVKLNDYDWVDLKGWAKERDGWRHASGATALIGILATNSFFWAQRRL